MTIVEPGCHKGRNYYDKVLLLNKWAHWANQPKMIIDSSGYCCNLTIHEIAKEPEEHPIYKRVLSRGLQPHPEQVKYQHLDLTIDPPANHLSLQDLTTAY